MSKLIFHYKNLIIFLLDATDKRGAGVKRGTGNSLTAVLCAADFILDAQLLEKLPHLIPVSLEFAQQYQDACKCKYNGNTEAAIQRALSNFVFECTDKGEEELKIRPENLLLIDLQNGKFEGLREYLVKKLGYAPPEPPHPRATIERLRIEWLAEYKDIDDMPEDKDADAWYLFHLLNEGC